MKKFILFSYQYDNLNALCAFLKVVEQQYLTCYVTSQSKKYSKQQKFHKKLRTIKRREASKREALQKVIATKKMFAPY